MIYVICRPVNIGGNFERHSAYTPFGFSSSKKISYILIKVPCVKIQELVIYEGVIY